MSDVQTNEVDVLKARIAHLESCLRPFAKAATRGEETSVAFRDIGFGSMDCRDVFVWQAQRGLCVRDFLDARAALTALKDAT